MLTEDLLCAWHGYRHLGRLLVQDIQSFILRGDHIVGTEQEGKIGNEVVTVVTVASNDMCEAVCAAGAPAGRAQLVERPMWKGSGRSWSHVNIQLGCPI